MYVDTQVSKYTKQRKDYFLCDPLSGEEEYALMANTNLHDYMQLQLPIERKVKMILR